MGLDMYLYVRKYEGVGYDEKMKDDFYPAEVKELTNKIKTQFFSKIQTFEVGYWRKANAIHHWIISNCADGFDNCSSIYISIDNAKELLETVKKVKENYDLAPELLPTQEGFFFGSQEYDEWYWNDLDKTEMLLENVIEFCEKYDYEIIYEASW